MAEIQNNTSTKQKGGKRIAIRSTRVDITPMVDLGFLLITFFVFTTTMARPVVIKVNQPNDRLEPNENVCASCALTVLLDSGNLIKYYEGDASKAIIKETVFGEDGIRKIIIDKKAFVKNTRGNSDVMVLIIKPLEGAHFMNFVDMVDEVTICGIKKYYLDEVRPEDRLLMTKNNY